MRFEYRIISILLTLLNIVPCSLVDLNAQSIEFDLPDNLVVCQSDELQLQIQNTGSDIISNAVLELALPCGLEYVSASVQGAFINNENDPENPVFNIPDLTSGESIIITLLLTAPCSGIGCIDTGELFRIIALLRSDHIGSESQSAAFVVSTPQAVITRIDFPILEGEKGDVITRKIYIRNSRPGFLDTLIYSDSYTTGLSIESDIGKPLNQSLGIFEVMLSGNDFRKFGDGDGLFEFNEELCLTETILIDACGFDYASIRSDLDVSWGCMNDYCDSPFPPQTALINLSYSILEGPILEFFPVSNSPCCYCGDLPAEQSMTIRNFSDIHSASSIGLTIDFKAFPESGFRSEDLIMETDTGTVKLEPLFYNVQSVDCDTLQTSFLFRIPYLGPGEEVSIYWNTYFCSTEECFADPYIWHFRSGYNKDCTWNDDSFHADSGASVPTDSILLRTGYMKAPDFEYLQEETLIIEVYSPFLTCKSGTLEIELNVSCQLNVLEQDWKLNDVDPLSVSSESSDEMTTYFLSYQLPLNFDTGIISYDVQCLCVDQCGPGFCKEEFITSCPAPCESESFLFDISTKARLNIDECNGQCLIEYCDFQIFSYDCDLPICETLVAGYLLADFELYRLNTGLPDNDNDHFPDQSGMLNFDSLRLDHAITGDTIRAEIKAEVIIDVEGSTFENVLIDFSTKLLGTEGLDPVFQFLEFTKLLDPDFGLININSELILVDVSEDQRYHCNDIPRFDQDSTGIKSFDLSLQELRNIGCAIPVDYKYEAGDSIYLTADFFVNYNIKSLLLNFGKIRYEVLNTNALYNGSLDGEDPFTCECHIQRIEIANYKTIVTSNGMSLDCCYGDGEGFSKIIKTGTFTDFFPYEYKPPVSLNTLLMPRVDGASLIEAKIVSIFSNGETLVDLLDTANHISLDFSEISADTIYFDLAENQTGFYILKPAEGLGFSWDENLEFRIFFKYKNEGCVFNGTQEYFGTSEFTYAPEILNSTINTDKDTSGNTTGKTDITGIRDQFM